MSSQAILCRQCFTHATYRRGVDGMIIDTWCQPNCLVLKRMLQQLFLESMTNKEAYDYYWRKIAPTCTENKKGCLEPRDKVIVCNYLRRSPRKVLWDYYNDRKNILRPRCIKGSSTCCNMEHADPQPKREATWNAAYY